MGEIKNLHEVLQHAMEEVKDIADKKHLEGPELVEFLEEFKLEVEVAMNTKIALAKTEFDKMIRAEREWEWAQEYKQEMIEQNSDPDDNEEVYAR